MFLLLSSLPAAEAQNYEITYLDVTIINAPDEMMAGISYDLQIRIENPNSDHIVELNQIQANMVKFSGNLWDITFIIAGNMAANEIEATLGTRFLEPGDVVFLNLTIKTGYWEKAGDYNLTIYVEASNGTAATSIMGTDNANIIVKTSILKYGLIAAVIFIAILIFIILMVRFGIYKLPKRKVKVAQENPKCQECGKEVDEHGLFCQLWETRSQRCRGGPFCSEECLQQHIRKGQHR